MFLLSCSDTIAVHLFDKYACGRRALPLDYVTARLQCPCLVLWMGTAPLVLIHFREQHSAVLLPLPACCHSVAFGGLFVSKHLPPLLVHGAGSAAVCATLVSSLESLSCRWPHEQRRLYLAQSAACTMCTCLVTKAEGPHGGLPRTCGCSHCCLCARCRRAIAWSIPPATSCCNHTGCSKFCAHAHVVAEQERGHLPQQCFR